MDPFNNFEQTSGLEKKWISVPSELDSVDGTKKEIKIELMDDGKPRSMAFFDIDGTLAHLNAIHGKAIQTLFLEQDQKNLNVHIMLVLNSEILFENLIECVEFILMDTMNGKIRKFIYKNGLLRILER